VLLGYLESSEPNYLQAGPGEAGLRHYEGTSGALQLLHPCLERPEITKYQALFEAEEFADRYRQAFFMTGQREDVLEAMASMASNLAQVGREGDAKFLKGGREHVASLAHCFGTETYPTTCTWEMAWAALRASMLSDRYWFSIQELQLLAACCGTRLEVHLLQAPGAGQQAALAPLEPQAFGGIPEITEVVKILLDTGGDPGGSRGHFSRLWSEREWEEHFARMGYTGAQDSDSDAESEENSESEESCSSTSTSSSEESLGLMGSGSEEGAAGGAGPCDPERKKPEEHNEAPPVPAEDDIELDEFSDISDNSDIFHVEVLPSEVPRTPEDADIQRISQLKHHMRRYPLLPAHPLKEGETYMDVDSCVRLPSVHCAFVGCKWSCDVRMEQHWEMERCLFRHLKHSHQETEMQPIFAHCDKEDDILFCLGWSCVWHSLGLCHVRAMCSQRPEFLFGAVCIQVA
jgi:predicted small metal-binding protein